MIDQPRTMAQQIAELASTLQQQRTGHKPSAVTVVLGGDAMVVTMHGALTPAELASAKVPGGAARIQDFHRQLFTSSADVLKREIARITGVEVREAATEIEPATGSIVHAFTSGTMIHVFLLHSDVPAGTWRTSSGPVAPSALDASAGGEQP
jgi:uncharacterized protein YbcI